MHIKSNEFPLQFFSEGHKFEPIQCVYSTLKNGWKPFNEEFEPAVASPIRYTSAFHVCACFKHTFSDEGQPKEAINWCQLYPSMTAPVTAAFLLSRDLCCNCTKFISHVSGALD